MYVLFFEGQVVEIVMFFARHVFVTLPWLVCGWQTMLVVFCFEWPSC